MRRLAPSTTAFVSLLVLVSYASAAFVDCERPTDDLVREVARRAASATSEVAMVPTCSCGCSETRALVGGSLARLGATIPAVYVAALPAAVVVDGRPAAGLVAPSPFVVDDPVPI